MKPFHKFASVSLWIAYLASFAYQYYRWTVHGVPAFDTFGPFEILVYLAALALASVSLLDKNWASWLTVAFCVAAYAVAFSYYFPVVYAHRTNGLIDGAESVVFLGFIFVAFVFSLLSIRSRKT